MNAEAEGRAMAGRFRTRHHLGAQPLGDLVAMIEQLAGIDVAVLDAERDEHGLAMRDPARGTVIIGVSRSRVPLRQRSSLAHELGHVLFGDWRDDSSCDWSARDPKEVRADAFARHLLVPAEGLREFLEPDKRIVEADLSAVVQRFLASPNIATIALRDAGYISEATNAAC
jgi:Zn-dependent peptidase ImmA (M78 family)